MSAERKRDGGETDDPGYAVGNPVRGVGPGCDRFEAEWRRGAAEDRNHLAGVRSAAVGLLPS